MKGKNNPDWYSFKFNQIKLKVHSNGSFVKKISLYFHHEEPPKPLKMIHYKEEFFELLAKESLAQNPNSIRHLNYLDQLPVLMQSIEFYDTPKSRRKFNEKKCEEGLKAAVKKVISDTRSIEK